jgi:regulatory protein
MASRPPDGAKLYEAALNHLARYAATEAGMALVLSRKVDRWARLYADKDMDPEVAAAAARRAKAEIPAVIPPRRAGASGCQGRGAASGGRRAGG